MKLPLKDFQERYVDELVSELHRASREVKESPARGQAVWLDAPTGSGKTLMVTAAIERLLDGDAKHAPLADAMFLWLSDQPELNEQTRNKMLATSSLLGLPRLKVIDSSFNEEVLPAGRIYFLNIQKLGEDRALVKLGDKRSYTIWQTITNSVSLRPHLLFLFIDEAHRGTSERRDAREEAATIVQKFIKGSAADGLARVPLIAGISATPERFRRLMEGAGRNQRPVEVPADEVRASGLLKEFIDIRHPRKSVVSDMTLLRRAATDWHDYWKRWEEYCTNSGVPVVRPILVVQVQDGTARQLTKTDLTECIRVIRDAVGEDAELLLAPSAFAHAFDHAKPASVGGFEMRHIRPSEISDDPDIRVVFFKTSLNTGWDCPRAETMMSFRTALDATAIAQLVGRMIRTPLARRINSDETLNQVSLYLPHYDEESLDKVVERLKSDQPVEVRRGEDVVTLTRAPDSDVYFTTLSALSSYIVPRPHRVSEVKRLMKFARQLTQDGIDDTAIATATDILVRTLSAEHLARKDTEEFQRSASALAAVEISGRRVRLGSEEEEEHLAASVAERAPEDVDAAFEVAGVRIGEGLHKAWWRRRVADDEAARLVGKLEAISLAAEPAVLAKLEAAGQKTTQAWLEKWREEIRSAPEISGDEYREIQALATRPELTARAPYPNSIDGNKRERPWPRHLYVDPRGKFYPAPKLNTWEVRLLEEELNREGPDKIVAWLRNPSQKGWSLVLPYRRGSEDHGTCPDLLMFRRGPRGRLIVDLLEPHSTHQADSAWKALGLAKYAELHGAQFGRIEFIIIDGDDVVRLNLKDERWRKKALVFLEGGDSEKLKQLLEEARAN